MSEINSEMIGPSMKAEFYRGGGRILPKRIAGVALSGIFQKSAE